MDTIEKALRKSGEPGSGWPRGERERDGTPQQDPANAEAPQETTPPGSAPSSDRYQELTEERLRRNGFLSRQDERSQLAEEFRIIKRPILENAFGPPSRLIPHGNLVMVTSAAPSEGKTYCSVNLALSIAREVNRTVLLVDADVARPALPRALGLGSRLGLLDVLLDQRVSLPDVLIRTNIPNLAVLPSGEATGCQPSCWPAKAWLVWLWKCPSDIGTASSCSIRHRCWPRARPAFWRRIWGRCFWSWSPAEPRRRRWAARLRNWNPAR